MSEIMTDGTPGEDAPVSARADSAASAGAASAAALPELQRPKGQLWTITRRELFAQLVSPISWVVLFLFYLFRGFEVYQLVSFMEKRGGDAEGFAMGYVASASTQFAIVLVPAILTMRSFAEEKRTGSLEHLMTAPVRDFDVVFGKWLASWIFFMLLWLPTLALLLVLQSDAFLGATMPAGQIFAGYIGLFALGSLLLSVGLFTSSLTDNQLLASLSAMIFAFALLRAPQEISQSLQVGAIDVDSGFGLVILDQFYVIKQLGQWFFRGLVDTGYLVFHVSTTGLFLFLTTRVIESRKWR
jgi:ABC-2 type transport system permease protein